MKRPKCIICGKRFATSRNKKTCSDACWKKHRSAVVGARQKVKKEEGDRNPDKLLGLRDIFLDVFYARPLRVLFVSMFVPAENFDVWVGW